MLEVRVLTWAAFFAPANTPPATIAFLNREITAILGGSQAHSFIARQGALPMLISPEEMRSFVSAELVHWARLVQIVGIPRR